MGSSQAPYASLLEFIMNKKEFDQSNMDEKFEFLYNGLSWLYKEMESLKQAAPTKNKKKKKSKIESYIKTAFKYQRDKYEKNNQKKFNISMDDVIAHFMGIESFVECYNKWKESGDDYYKPTIFYSDCGEESMECFPTSTLGKYRILQKEREEQKSNLNVSGGKPSKLAPDGSTWPEWIKKQKEEKGTK